MNDAEVAGRLVALEVVAMTALGLYLANSRNDPDYSKAAALIDHIKEGIRTQAQTLPPAAQRAATRYADGLLALALENLRLLRGEGGATH